MIPKSEWEWFGHHGHLIVGRDCRFHLCTRVGDVLVSTVGEYLPDSRVRDILAESRKIVLVGRGDAREADWMRKIGFEEIGAGRKYETMVFRVTDKRCAEPGCDCGMPLIDDWSGLDSDGYNLPGVATKGHMAMCEKYASGEIVLVADSWHRDDAVVESQVTRDDQHV